MTATKNTHTKIDRQAVSDLVERVRREIDSGRLPAAQVALGFQGEIVLFEALGDCSADSRFHTFSAVKPSVSLTVMQLAAQGDLSLDAPVADVLSEFAANGKEAISVSQVLLHAGGFPHAPLRIEAWSDRSARLQAYRGWHTNWTPGSRFEYHATSAHWVLADIITEVTGRHYAEVVAERMFTPAGCRSWLEFDPAAPPTVVDLTAVGVEPDPETLLRTYGVSELPESEVTMLALLAFNDPLLRRGLNPGAGGITDAADLTRWYQAVLHDDGELLSREVKRDAMTVRQAHLDWLGTPANRSHAFVLAGGDGRAVYRGHAQAASPQAFGHSGAKGQISWADPASGLSFAFLTNGLDRSDLVTARRSISLSSKAHACAS